MRIEFYASASTTIDGMASQPIGGVAPASVPPAYQKRAVMMQFGSSWRRAGAIEVAPRGPVIQKERDASSPPSFLIAAIAFAVLDSCGSFDLNGFRHSRCR
jgi:hypothetical protein